jgi:tetratricopeptide (TPR) repeat protein
MEKPQYLKLERQGPNDWAFNRPREWEFFDHRLEKAEASEREGDGETAIKICVEIINSCPEYLSAVNKLGLLYRQQGDMDKAIYLFESAVGVGLACLPDEFEEGTDLIPWHWEDNRAFLLACEYLGLCHLDKALDSYEYLLEINPGYRDAGLVAKLRKILGIEDEVME